VTSSAEPQPLDHGSAASRGVLGRGSIYTVGTAAPVLANIAVLPAVTRLVQAGPQGTDGYGVISNGIILMQVGMMLLGLGMSSVITRHGILSGTGIGGARTLLVRGAALSWGLAAVVLLLWPAWRGLLSPPFEVPAAIALVGSACWATVDQSQALLRAMDRPGRFVTLSLIATLGGPALGLALLLGEATPTRYLLGVVVGYAAAAGLGLVFGLGSGARAHQQGDTRAALRLGVPIVPHVVSLFLASGALVFLAKHFYGFSASGRMNLAVLLGSSPGVITAALNNSWAPVVYRADPEHRGAVLERTARDIGALAALVAGGVALLSPWLLRIAAPATYGTDQLVPAVAIIAGGAVLSVGYLANVHLVFAAGRTAGLSLVTPVSLTLGLGAAALVGSRGLTWIAVGFPAAYLCLAAGTAVLRRRVGGARWREQRLLAPVLLAAALLAAGATLPVTGAMALSRWGLAAVAGTGVILLGRRIVRR
jgi:hypothetical protein